MLFREDPFDFFDELVREHVEEPEPSASPPIPEG